MGTYNAQRSINATMLNKRTDDCINVLGIDHLANHSLDKLSDGELQKAMIARALAQEPCFLLLDEPTTFLDYVAKEELMQTLKVLCTNQGIGIVFTSHDIDIMDRYAERRLELRQGKIHELHGVSRI
jgi:iron complex transport system ATP-binding protein